MKSALVPISWGELFDKITILQIKSEKITSSTSLMNVNRELQQLKLVFDRNFKANSLATKLENELRQINSKLWEIEDQIFVDNLGEYIENKYKDKRIQELEEIE